MPAGAGVFKPRDEAFAGVAQPVVTCAEPPL
jgi:hypothetical protein